MIQITKELAENLIDDIGSLISDLADLKIYPRYANRIKNYEKEIEELKMAIINEDAPTNPRS
jgi:hypothetical protein